MAINTYEALNTVTLASAASAATFTSIPQGYTDLILICNVGSQSTNAFPYLQFNGDTETNYSFSQLYGTGSGAFNSRVANTNQLFNSDVSMKQDAVNATNIYHIMNYSNTTTFKTSLSRQNTLNAADYNGTLAAVGIWRSTAAINRIDVKATRGGTAYNFIAGSTFTLYGVKAWANTEASPKATGGWVSSDSSYWYHTFPFSSTFTVSQALTADILTVGGGSSGIYGNYAGPGGGGGEAKVSTSQSLSVTSYAVTVGAGGAATTSGSAWTAGATTSFGSITALGAGQSPYTTAGQSGTGFTANGGVGGSTSSEYSGGGGGSTANGTAAAGGAGLTTSFSGVSTSYGGGGGGGLGTAYTIGVSYGRGTDGGGNGASSAGPGTSGASTRGGGGGGGTQFRGATSGAAGNGGSGLVIVRYVK